MSVKGETEVEEKKSKRTRKTIYGNPAMVVIGDDKQEYDSKEDAEKWIEGNLEEGEKAKLFLLYQTYELEVVTTKKVKAK